VLEALARRDQQRALATLQAEKEAPTPTQALAAEEHIEPFDLHGPIGSRAPFMEMVDFCVAPSTTLDSVTASSPPPPPAQPSPRGGPHVAGVGSHLTQDTGTETDPVEETTASHQTHDAGAGASATPAYETGNGWVASDGWIANEAGTGWVAPDGAHWGATTPREQPPLKLTNDKWSQQRALERREERLRRSNDELPGCTTSTSRTSLTRRVVIPSRHSKGKQTTKNGIPNDMGMWN
jgi:hypothetical protein